MKKVNKCIDTVMRFLMALSMFLLVAFGFWQIFTRWILQNPSTFTDEFLRYVLIWASLIGSAYCFYMNQHLSLGLLTDRAKGVPKLILSIFIEACVLFFVIYVFIRGGWALSAYSTNVSSVMHIPYKVLYAILPITGIMIVVARVLKYIELIQNHFAQNKEGKL
jgi:TRAP-type C4-dicarboxylate transport system permease small subunit